MKLYRLAAALGAMFLFALLASPALAGDVVYLKVFDDTLAINTPDSTAVVNVSGYDLINLVLVVTTMDGGDGADSTAIVYVETREVLPAYAVSRTSAQYDSTSYQSVAAAVSDTSLVPWLANIAIRQTDAASAAADTIAYNSLDGSATLPGSGEIRVRFPARPVAGVVFRPRAVTVPLVSTLGVPFNARFAQFKFRLPGITDAHQAVNLRVVLKGVTY